MAIQKHPVMKGLKQVCTRMFSHELAKFSNSDSLINQNGILSAELYF